MSAWQQQSASSSAADLTLSHAFSQSIVFPEHASSKDETRRFLIPQPSPGRSGTKCRPLSAMANMSRGLASCAEKVQIEELKKEIREITRNIAASGKMGDDDRMCRDTEEVLKRFVYTNDAGQVQMAKSALQTMVLQKQEEFSRHALMEISSMETAERERKPREGKIVDMDLSQTRFEIMLGLVQKAKGQRKDLEERTRQHHDALAGLKNAKEDIKKLTEERDLMRATLSSGHGSGGRKINRPLTAPRQRQTQFFQDVCPSCLIIPR